MAPDRGTGWRSSAASVSASVGRIRQPATIRSRWAIDERRGGRPAAFSSTSPVYGPRAPTPLRFAHAPLLVAGSACTCRSAPAWSRPRTGRPRSAPRRSRCSPTTRRRGAARRRLPEGCRRSGKASPSGHRTDRDPRAVPRELAGPEPRFTSSRSPCSRTSCGSAGRTARRSSTSTSGRTAARAPTRARPADGGIAAALERADRHSRRRRTLGDIAIVLENGSRRRVRHGHDDRGAARSTRVARRRRAAARLGFCLDTAHLWGAGYPIDTAEGVDEVLAAFDGRSASTGWPWSTSTTPLGAARARDRHEHVGAGRIGGRGLAALLTHPGLGARRLHPRDTGHGRGLRRGQPRRARALGRGEPLDAAASRAFHLRSAGRSRRPTRTVTPAPMTGAGDAAAAPGTGDRGAAT